MKTPAKCGNLRNDMSEAAPQKFRRRNFFIKKGLQSRFILGFSLAVFLGFILNLLLVYFLIDRELSQELYKIHLRIRTTAEIASPILWKLSAVIIPAVLAASAGIGYVLTHKVEVPLLDLKDALRKTSQGDFKQTITESVTDELPEVFNSAERALGERFGSFKTSVSALSSSFDSLYIRYRSGEITADGVKSALNEVSAARHNVWRELEKFKV